MDVNAIIDNFRKIVTERYVDFQGRARRSEYWYFVLVYVVISIVLPHGYPNMAPRIYASQVATDAPHRWPDGSLSIFGATAAWNTKTHDATHALTLARGWLKNYAKWRKTGAWPERTDAE